MACDLCGAKGTPLADLLSHYKTDEVEAVCPKCEKELNAKLWKIRSVLDGWMRTTLKRWVHERHAVAHGVLASRDPQPALHACSVIESYLRDRNNGPYPSGAVKVLRDYIADVSGVKGPDHG